MILTRLFSEFNFKNICTKGLFIIQIIFGESCSNTIIILYLLSLQNYKRVSSKLSFTISQYLPRTKDQGQILLKCKVYFIDNSSVNYTHPQIFIILKKIEITKKVLNSFSDRRYFVKKKLTVFHTIMILF